jgi:hypothetical protein
MGNWWEFMGIWCKFEREFGNQLLKFGRNFWKFCEKQVEN